MRIKSVIQNIRKQKTTTKKKTPTQNSKKKKKKSKKMRVVPVHAGHSRMFNRTNKYINA